MTSIPFPSPSLLENPADLSDEILLCHFLGRRHALFSLPRPGWTPKELALKHGLLEEEAWKICAAVELGRRCLKKKVRPARFLRGGKDVYRHLSPRLSALRTECFYALYLDAKGGVLLEKVISQGTLTSSLVHPREVFSPTILCRAAAGVVAHNHPSGDPEPSAEDRSTTRRLQRARRLLGIELLDHVVVGQGQYQSFLEQGWI